MADANWKTVRETAYDLVVLPWGATEAHNFHLPYSTDTKIAEYIADCAAVAASKQGCKVAVLPAIPFGVQSAQLDVKLNINMMPSTQLAVLKDIVESLEIQGFRKLLLLNSHGGNTFVSALREIYPRTKVRIFLVNTYAIVDAKRHFEVPGEHAGALQTSALMHIAPELVRPLAEAGNGYARSLKIPSMKEGWVWSQRGWLGEVTEDTGIGNPHGASAAKGRAFLDEVVAKVSTLMLEIAALDSSQPYE